MSEELVDQIDELLPQTQCRRCLYPGCRPYAQAIASGLADINQCPPGGEAGIRALAQLLGREFRPLNPEHGVEGPTMLAWIDEQVCIGCTKCIQACPVDAIIGAPKLMHTVIRDECTGCELCVAPCPVDCIVMLPCEQVLTDGQAQAVKKPNAFSNLSPVSGSLPQDKKNQFRQRFDARNARLQRDEQQRNTRLSSRAEVIESKSDQDPIQAAIVRAKVRKQSL
jgi:electron transport complex protein RnfB